MGGVIVALVVHAMAHGEFPGFGPNPAAIGWKPVPLNQSTAPTRLPLMSGTIPTYLK